MFLPLLWKVDNILKFINVKLPFYEKLELLRLPAMTMNIKISKTQIYIFNCFFFFCSKCRLAFCVISIRSSTKDGCCCTVFASTLYQN